MDKDFNPKGKLTIEDVHAWMDGGTVTLVTRDSEFNVFEIEFVQKVSLQRQDNQPCPGSLLLDKREVKIRSEEESKILASIKDAEWGLRILDNEKGLLTRMINECVNFVASEQYLRVARGMGRIN